MVAETSSRGSRLFPEISIHLRKGTRASRISVAPLTQIGAVLAAVIVVGAFCYLCVSRLGHDRLVAAKEAEVVRAETATADLQDEISGLRDKLAIAERDRTQAEARVPALTAQVDSLRGLLAGG